MYFKIKCPHCEKSLKVRDELAGRKCGCPYCKGTVRIPESVPTETPGGFPGIDVSAAPKGKGGKTPVKAKRPVSKKKGSAAVEDTSDVPCCTAD